MLRSAPASSLLSPARHLKQPSAVRPGRKRARTDTASRASKQEQSTAEDTEQETLKSGRAQETDQDDTASREELLRLADTRRQRARDDDMGLLEGILDETRRISWPSPLQALKDTVTVVGIVAVSAVVLFGLNTGLTEGSKVAYRLLGR